MNHFFAQVVFKSATLVALIAILGVSSFGANFQVSAETIEEEKRDKAKAERETAETYLPKIESTPPDGSISVNEKLKFENTLLAYRAMSKVAGKIQAEIVDKLGYNISLIVFDGKVAPIISAQLDFKIFKDRVNAIKKDYKNLGVELRSSVSRQTLSHYNLLNPTTAATTSFLFDLLPFFRVDRTFEGTSFNVENQAFVAQLSSKFRESNKSKVSVYYPAEYPLIRKDAIDEILTDIGTLQQLRRQAQEKILNLADPKKTNLGKVNENVKILVNDLKKIDQKTGKSLLEEVVKYRSLQLIAGSDRDFDKGKIYFLSVKVIAGGTSRTTRSFLTNGLRHSGGAIVKYIIYDDNASIVLSNIHDAYTGFTKVPDSK